MYKILTLVWCFFFTTNVHAQEIMANVIIDAELIQTQEKQIFQDMKETITQFLNTRRWTNDKFSAQEKIKLTIQIRLQSVPSVNKYKATAQIQSSRPTYGTGYESPVLTFFDTDFNFDYAPSQPIDFNENAYQNNLSSLLAFYAYLAIAMDYDSFSKGGGTQYFDKLVLIMNNAQSGPEAGWRQAESNNNSRYWLLENLTSPQFKEFREGTYVYHRLGLDGMLQDPELGRSKILEVLTNLKKVYDIRSNSCLLRTYFNTKDLELINVFSDGTSSEKSKAIELLKTMDPTNTEKYEKIIK